MYQPGGVNLSAMSLLELQQLYDNIQMGFIFVDPVAFQIFWDYSRQRYLTVKGLNKIYYAEGEETKT